MAQRGEPQTVLKYGMHVSVVYDPVQLEIDCIRKGGQWQRKDGSLAGEGLFFHYKRLQQLLWPEDHHHRWSDLILKEILQNRITAIIGCRDSGKTYGIAKYGLTDYFCFPNETLILISSTDMRGLELRVWGELKGQFRRAKERVPWLPGHLIDSKHCIATDNLQEDEHRDLRKGIVTIPCLSAGGQWTGGLSRFVGLKQKRRRLLGDEAQFMKPAYLESLANLNDGDFKGVFVGNPLGEGDPLDKISEPKDGWGTEGDVTKTTSWDNRFIEGRTLNLVGTDSPNFDQSQEPTAKYSFLNSQKSIDHVVAFYGMDSLQYYMFCLGVRKPGLHARRVLSKKMCVKFGAFDSAVWLNTQQTKVYGVDAAYGGLGGDRCVGIRMDFGPDITGKIILKVYAPDLIPVSIKEAGLPEDQIAEWVKRKCEGDGIPATNVFYDATGRGSLGTSFARIWSAYVNPVEFGGKPTDRPVSSSLQVRDAETGQMRLKLCSDHYSKWVTEAWFSVRYVVESRQMRELPEGVMDEFCRREWKMVRGDKIEVETKDEMKLRVNISPDLADAAATCLEGARRLGFHIAAIENPLAKKADDSWKTLLRDRAKQLRTSHELQYT